MKELQISIKSSLEALKDTVDKFTNYNRGDKKVIYDIYLSEFTSLTIYLEETSIPSVFKRNELKVLLNKIDDEVLELNKILSCYLNLEERRNQLETDFNIVEKNTVFYHHLEDLAHTMEMYLGFDKAEKFRSLEVMFDQVIERLKDQKMKKSQSFQNELFQLKVRVIETQIENKDDLIKKVDGLIDELDTSGIFNQKKTFLIKKEIDNKERLSRKRVLRKNILNMVKTRLLGGADSEINNSFEDFDVELEKIKKSASDLAIK